MKKTPKKKRLKNLKSTKQTEKTHHKYLENTNVALKEESDVEEP